MPKMLDLFRGGVPDEFCDYVVKICEEEVND